MNRTIDWDDWRLRRSAGMQESVRLTEGLSRSRRGGSSRIRAQDDVAIITRMMRIELDRRISEGRLVRLGPRQYELHVRAR